MNQNEWDQARQRYLSSGWTLTFEKRYWPMIGRYLELVAVSADKGADVVISAPTLKIALKKLDLEIQRRAACSPEKKQPEPGQ